MLLIGDEAAPVLVELGGRVVKADVFKGQLILIVTQLQPLR